LSSPHDAEQRHLHERIINMFTSRTRLSGIALVLLCTTVGGIWYGFAFEPRAGAEQPKESKVKALLKERLAILRELAANTTKGYKQGSVSMKEVHEANETVLQAELELAETREERIPILEKFVAEAKNHEEHVAPAAKQGQPVPLLEAKAHRLKAEIALERERQKPSDKR
jgi:hypothetical protein